MSFWAAFFAFGGMFFFVAAGGVVDSTPGFFLVMGMSPLVGLLAGLLAIYFRRQDERRR